MKTTLHSLKPAGYVCPCKKHKTELEQLLFEAEFASCTSNSNANDVQSVELQEESSEDKALQTFVERHQVMLECRLCALIYMNLLRAPYEQTAKLYLTSSYRKCFRLENKMIGEQ